LRVRKAKGAPLEIHVLPAKRQDLAHTTTREDQKTECCDCGSGHAAGAAEIVQSTSQTRQLLLTREPLAVPLGEPLHVADGISPILPQTPALGEVEHLREKSQNSVRLVRSLPESIPEPVD